MNDTRWSVSLDGAWTRIDDPNDSGKVEHWHETPPEAGTDVSVPAEHVIAPDLPGGVSWYTRSFDLEALPDGRVWKLHLGGVSYAGDVWLNGHSLGRREGAYASATFDATAALREGANRVVLRVEVPSADHGAAGLRPEQLPLGTVPAATPRGLWGSVHLECLHAEHLREVILRPDTRRKRLTVEVAAPANAVVRATVTETGTTAEGPASDALHLSLDDLPTWSPETPELFTLDVSLLVDGVITDTVSQPFGMREFGARGDRIFINGRPTQLRGLLVAPTDPLLAPATTVDAWKSAFTTAKGLGFNWIRFEGRPAPVAALDAAAHVGMLVAAGTPIYGLKHSNPLREICQREIDTLIRRDRNATAQFLWVLMEQTGNAFHASQGGPQAMRDEMGKRAQALDPTRIIVDDCGGEVYSSQPSSVHRPFHDTAELWHDLRVAPLHPESPNTISYLRTLGEGDAPILVTLAARRVSVDTAQLEDGVTRRDMTRIVPDGKALLEAADSRHAAAIHSALDGLRDNPRVAAYCVDPACWGRNLASLGVAPMTEAGQALRPIIRLSATVLSPRQEIPVLVTIANDARLESRADLSLQVVGPTNQVLWKKKRGIKLPRTSKELWSGTIAASGSPGTHRLVVRIMDGHRRIAESSADFHVFDPVAPADVAVNVVDPNGEWTPRIKPLAALSNLQAPVHVVPPLANTIRAYPDNEIGQILGQVREGAVALVFTPPSDWNDLAEYIDRGVTATSAPLDGAPWDIVHYAKLHPVFDGLPARSIMRGPYIGVLPYHTLLEEGEEDICGLFCRGGLPETQDEDASGTSWGTSILVRRFGSGRIVFIQLRVLEKLGRDVVADRLFVNMLRHFSRRSVPTSGILPVHQESVEWLRRERTERVRRWSVLGVSAPDSDSPLIRPDGDIDLNATHSGLYRPIAWRRWYSLKEDDHAVDLHRACEEGQSPAPSPSFGVAYAYAEFTADVRHETVLRMGVQSPTTAWLNGRPMHESKVRLAHDDFDYHECPIFVKQGRNTLLVRVEKAPGPFQFSAQVLEAEDTPPVKWWK